MGAMSLFEKWIDYLRRPGQARARAGTHNHECRCSSTLRPQLDPRLVYLAMSPCVRGDDILVVASSPSHPGLGAIARVALMLRLLVVLLLFLLSGAVAAVEAAGGSSEPAVVAGIVTGDAADRCTLQAAFGLGGNGRERERGDGEQGDK
jgi:hypothetical protein